MGLFIPITMSPGNRNAPYQDVDPWTSFGKIMPGITQIWQRQEGEVFGSEEGVPDCILIIDSSASMTNPRQELSFAVLGAACAAMPICEMTLR